MTVVGLSRIEGDSYVEELVWSIDLEEPSRAAVQRLVAENV